MEKEMKMSVSPVCVKDGKQYAYVSFTDGNRSLEGRIPECEIISNRGFTEEEADQLVDYMRRELRQLKKMASGIRLLDAFSK